MKYDNSVRYQAFETYILTGSLSSTAIACSLSADTVRDWAHEENWSRKLKAHREKIQRQILKDLYLHQIAELKEFGKWFSYDLGGKSTGVDANNGGRKSRSEYGANGLVFRGEELKIDWFVRSLKQQPDDQCELDSGQVISFAKTACTFGGFRYWFNCPDCDRRCATLYKKKSRYSCRVCLRIKYHR